MDAEDVARLRIALTRITRVLDRQSRGHILTGTQASVLATSRPARPGADHRAGRGRGRQPHDALA